jgi:dolichyl-phosphate beta-glucosyltransferase
MSPDRGEPDGPELAIVVPCYDEAARIDGAELGRLIDGRPGWRLVLVDDGSTDGTLAVLEAIAATRPEQVSVVVLARNGGKAAAVAAGMQAAGAAGAGWIGYFDADLATPVDELVRLATFRSDQLDGVLASRVRLLGRTIERRLSRHLVGRVFATFASTLLGLPLYDTQCGAKLFRSTPALDAALAEPFRTRWLFDVELLARLLHPPPGVTPIAAARMVEVPLRTWHDVAGSKLSARSVRRISREALRLAADVRRRRRRFAA